MWKVNPIVGGAQDREDFVDFCYCCATVVATVNMMMEKTMVMM